MRGLDTDARGRITGSQGVGELRKGQSAQGFVDNKHSAMVAEKKSRKLLTEKLGHVLLFKLNATPFYRATYTWGPLTSQRGLCEETWAEISVLPGNV